MLGYKFRALGGLSAVEARKNFEWWCVKMVDNFKWWWVKWEVAVKVVACQNGK
jgi:hypothetical protein